MNGSIEKIGYYIHCKNWNLMDRKEKKESNVERADEGKKKLKTDVIR